MNAYIKLLVFVLWPGIVSVLYSMLFLTPEFQLIFHKWIVFVYVLLLPVIVYTFTDQYRYDKESQRMMERNK